MITITLVGRLGADPELKQIQGGKTVCNFSVAVDTGFGEAKGTEWFRCAVWGNRAEPVAKHFGKGKPIALTGRLSTRKFTDRSGVERTSLEVDVTEWAFVPGDSSAGQGQGQGQGASQGHGYGQAPHAPQAAYQPGPTGGYGQPPHQAHQAHPQAPPQHTPQHTHQAPAPYHAPQPSQAPQGHQAAPSSPYHDDIPF